MLPAGTFWHCPPRERRVTLPAKSALTAGIARSWLAPQVDACPFEGPTLLPRDRQSLRFSAEVEAGKARHYGRLDGSELCRAVMCEGNRCATFGFTSLRGAISVALRGFPLHGLPFARAHKSQSVLACLGGLDGRQLHHSLGRYEQRFRAVSRLSVVQPRSCRTRFQAYRSRCASSTALPNFSLARCRSSSSHAVMAACTVEASSSGKRC